MGRFFAMLACASAAACGRLGFDPDADCALALTPSAARVNYHSSVTFTASGGVEPYDYALVGGMGQLAGGKLTVTDQPGSATVEAIDAAGCSAEARVDIGGDALFYVGGASAGLPMSDVLRSDDGETWTVIGQLPSARTNGALLVLEDELFWISGERVNNETDVFASRDGITWRTAGNVPVAATAFGHTVHDGALWMVGGNGNAGAVTTSRDGATWTTVGSLPEDNHGGTLSVLRDHLVYTGGHNAVLYDWVLTSPDGATWTRAGTLPQGREYHGAVSLADTLWLVGGQNTNPTALPLVTSTSDETSFASNPPLPAGRPHGGLVLFRDRLWSIGGSDGGGIFSSSPGGDWTIHTTTFPAPRMNGGVVAFTPH